MSAVARRSGVVFGFLWSAVLALTIGCKAMPTTHYYVLEPSAGASDGTGSNDGTGAGTVVPPDELTYVKTITGDVTCADTESSLRGSANVTGSTASCTDFDA